MSSEKEKFYCICHYCNRPVEQNDLITYIINRYGKRNYHEKCFELFQERFRRSLYSDIFSNSKFFS